SWQSVGPPAAAGLQFRDIQAFDKDHAVIVSIGNNTTDFRVYVTSDGGAHWTQTFTNAEPTAFYDCMTFFNRHRGLVVSDPVNGIAFHDAKHGIAVGGDFAAPTASPNAVALTSDGGRTWRPAASAPSEYRSGVDFLRGHTAIDVGLSGSDYSTDGGNTWTTFD